MAVCKLCGNNTDLLRKSHIIPDFMYKGLFDQRHRISLVKILDLKPIKILQTGFYDKEVLCKKCDNEKLSKLEFYASRAMYGGELPKNESPIFRNSISHENIKSISIENLDYRKFKLFLLSILYRAHISVHPFFKNIDIVEYAEKLKEMLSNDDPGGEDEFETCLIIVNSNDIPNKSIANPIYLKTEKNDSCMFMINKIIYHYNLSPEHKLSLFKKGRICKNNTMEIAVLEGEMANSYFDSFLGNKIRVKTK